MHVDKISGKTERLIAYVVYVHAENYAYQIRASRKGSLADGSDVVAENNHFESYKSLHRVGGHFGYVFGNVKHLCASDIVVKYIADDDKAVAVGCVHDKGELFVVEYGNSSVSESRAYVIKGVELAHFHDLIAVDCLDNARITAAQPELRSESLAVGGRVLAHIRKPVLIVIIQAACRSRSAESRLVGFFRFGIAEKVSSYAAESVAAHFGRDVAHKQNLSEHFSVLVGLSNVKSVAAYFFKSSRENHVRQTGAYKSAFAYPLQPLRKAHDLERAHVHKGGVANRSQRRGEINNHQRRVAVKAVFHDFGIAFGYNQLFNRGGGKSASCHGCHVVRTDIRRQRHDGLGISVRRVFAYGISGVVLVEGVNEFALRYGKLSVKPDPYFRHILRNLCSGKGRVHGLVGVVAARLQIIIARSGQIRADCQRHRFAFVVGGVETFRRNIVDSERNSLCRCRIPPCVNSHISRHRHVKVENFAARLGGVPIVEHKTVFGGICGSGRFFALIHGLRLHGRAAVRVKGHLVGCCAAACECEQQHDDQNYQNSLFHGFSPF